MEFHADLGPQYEGEVIRKENLYIEFGGPKVARKFELATVKSPDEIENEKVEIIGPDINELVPYNPETDKGGTYPIAILIDVAGSVDDASVLVSHSLMIRGGTHN